MALLSALPVRSLSSTQTLQYNCTPMLPSVLRQPLAVPLPPHQQPMHCAVAAKDSCGKPCCATVISQQVC